MEDETPKGSIKDIMAYFGRERAVTPGEFKKFWETCSDDEKNYYKTAVVGL
jgi:hypothetical protein